MYKPSIREALRIAKQVKLGLASGAEGLESNLTAEDRERIYKRKLAKAGKTPGDAGNERKYDDWLLKECGLL
jgi:hypothetical protein